MPWVDLQPPRDDTHELTVTVAVIARRITNSVLFIFVVFRVELSHAKQGLTDHRVIQRKRMGKQRVSSAKQKVLKRVVLKREISVGLDDQRFKITQKKLNLQVCLLKT